MNFENITYFDFLIYYFKKYGKEYSEIFKFEIISKEISKNENFKRSQKMAKFKFPILDNIGKIDIQQLRQELEDSFCNIIEFLITQMTQDVGDNDRIGINMDIDDFDEFKIPYQKFKNFNLNKHMSSLKSLCEDLIYKDRILIIFQVVIVECIHR